MKMIFTITKKKTPEKSQSQLKLNSIFIQTTTPTHPIYVNDSFVLPVSFIFNLFIDDDGD